jgi:hypothetical protein
MTVNTALVSSLRCVLVPILLVVRRGAIPKFSRHAEKRGLGRLVTISARKDPAAWGPNPLFIYLLKLLRRHGKCFAESVENYGSRKDATACPYLRSSESDMLVNCVYG